MIMNEGEGHISTDSYWEIEILHSMDRQCLGEGVFTFTHHHSIVLSLLDPLGLHLFF